MRQTNREPHRYTESWWFYLPCLIFGHDDHYIADGRHCCMNCGAWRVPSWERKADQQSEVARG